MANRRARAARFVPKKRMSRQSRRPKNNRGKRFAKSGALGPLNMGSVAKWVGRGVRNLVSIVPGAEQIIKFADFAFKNIAWATSGMTMETTAVTIDGIDLTKGYAITSDGDANAASVVGMGACIGVYSWALLRDTPHAITGKTAAGDTTWQCNYTHMRVKNLTIQISNEAGLDATGLWAACLSPIYGNKEHVYWKSVKTVFEFEDVMKRPGAVVTQAKNTIRLHHRATPSDDFSFLPSQIDGSDVPKYVVVVAYQRLERTTFGNFTPDYVAPRITISGNYELLNLVDIPVNIPKADVWDYYTSISIGIKTPKGKYGIANTKKEEFANTSKGIQIKKGSYVISEVTSEVREPIRDVRDDVSCVSSIQRLSFTEMCTM